MPYFDLDFALEVIRQGKARAIIFKDYVFRKTSFSKEWYQIKPERKKVSLRSIVLLLRKENPDKVFVRVWTV